MSDVSNKTAGTKYNFSSYYNLLENHFKSGNVVGNDSDALSLPSVVITGQKVAEDILTLKGADKILPNGLKVYELSGNVMSLFRMAMSKPSTDRAKQWKQLCIETIEGSFPVLLNVMHWFASLANDVNFFDSAAKADLDADVSKLERYEKEWIRIFNSERAVDPYGNNINLNSRIGPNENDTLFDAIKKRNICLVDYSCYNTLATLANAVESGEVKGVYAALRDKLGLNANESLRVPTEIRNKSDLNNIEAILNSIDAALDKYSGAPVDSDVAGEEPVGPPSPEDASSYNTVGTTTGEAGFEPPTPETTNRVSSAAADGEYESDDNSWEFGAGGQAEDVFGNLTNDDPQDVMNKLLYQTKKSARNENMRKQKKFDYYSTPNSYADQLADYLKDCSITYRNVG